MMPTISALLRDASSQIESETPRLDAEILLSFALKKNTAWLFAHSDDELTHAEQDFFLILLARRKTGEPIAHITGTQGFWSLNLSVTPDTLIPRPETELLVELAVSKIAGNKPVRVLDLGTGSGAIALAIAGECQNADVIAVDKSVDALIVARKNADKNNLKLEFIQSDWFSALKNQCFDLIASNPPYISNTDSHLTLGDVRFEPLTALASGVDGLDDIRQIVSTAPQHCMPGTWLMIEHGFDQGEQVRNLFLAAGYIDVETVQDLEQRDRVTVGQWSLLL
jgi:release factor glutamine methyltransferase